MKRVYQVLFSRPLQYEDGVIYGVRVACDEGKAKRLMDYAVELVGHWSFTEKHGGKITEDYTKWVDANGNIYRSGLSTRLYSYTAALSTRTYIRIDEWWVDDDYDLENGGEITSPSEYFNARCLLEEDDYKTGYNGWLQVYQKLLSRYNRLTQLGRTNNEMLLNYDDQDDMMWMSQIFENKEVSIGEEAILDELPV